MTVEREDFSKFLDDAVVELNREFPGDNDSTIYRMCVALNNATHLDKALKQFSGISQALYDRESA